MHIFHWSISIWRCCCCCCSCSISPKDRQCTFSAALFWISWSVISDQQKPNKSHCTYYYCSAKYGHGQLCVLTNHPWRSLSPSIAFNRPNRKQKGGGVFSLQFTAVTAVTTTTTIVIDGIINFIGNINCVHLETDRVCVRHRCCTITAWWASSFLLWERRQTWCGIHQAAYHHSKRGGR